MVVQQMTSDLGEKETKRELQGKYVIYLNTDI